MALVQRGRDLALGAAGVAGPVLYDVVADQVRDMLTDYRKRWWNSPANGPAAKRIKASNGNGRPKTNGFMRRNGKAGYSTRSKGQQGERYQKSQRIGTGFPPRMSGILKMQLQSDDLDNEGSSLRIGQMILVDMNNDQRGATAVATEGLSHWTEFNAGTPLNQRYRTPFYFDTLASLYQEYLISYVSTKITFQNNMNEVAGDMSICYKTFKPHDDEAEVLRKTTSAELIQSQDRMKILRLNPQIAGRTGRPSTKTIWIKWKVSDWIPARVWFSEQADTGIGEKIFSSTAEITDVLASHMPRVVFWAFHSFTGTGIVAGELSVDQQVWYHYTAFGRKLPSLS